MRNFLGEGEFFVRKKGIIVVEGGEDFFSLVLEN
jgi:hypothetical protein